MVVFFLLAVNPLNKWPGDKSLNSYLFYADGKVVPIFVSTKSAFFIHLKNTHTMSMAVAGLTDFLSVLKFVATQFN